MEHNSAHFRLIAMPCCQQLLCWVNPRLPNYCPECGTFVYADLKQIKPECILESHPEAWVSYGKRPNVPIGEALQELSLPEGSGANVPVEGGEPEADQVGSSVPVPQDDNTGGS